MRAHRARAGTFAGDRAVHHREDSGMDLLLDPQPVHDGLVDHRVGPVAVEIEQTAEGVLHGSGGAGEDVGLHRRQVDDIPADQHLRNLDA